MLSLARVQVQPLVRELRSCKSICLYHLTLKINGSLSLNPYLTESINSQFMYSWSQEQGMCHLDEMILKYFEYM